MKNKLLLLSLAILTVAQSDSLFGMGRNRDEIVRQLAKEVKDEKEESLKQARDITTIYMTSDDYEVQRFEEKITELQNKVQTTIKKRQLTRKKHQLLREITTTIENLRESRLINVLKKIELYNLLNTLKIKLHGNEPVDVDKIKRKKPTRFPRRRQLESMEEDDDVRRKLAQESRESEREWGNVRRRRPRRHRPAKKKPKTTRVYEDDEEDDEYNIKDAIKNPRVKTRGIDKFFNGVIY